MLTYKGAKKYWFLREKIINDNEPFNAWNVVISGQLELYVMV